MAPACTVCEQQKQSSGPVGTWVFRGGSAPNDERCAADGDDHWSSEQSWELSKSAAVHARMAIATTRITKLPLLRNTGLYSSISRRNTCLPKERPILNAALLITSRCLPDALSLPRQSARVFIWSKCTPIGRDRRMVATSTDGSDSRPPLGDRGIQAGGELRV